MPRSAGSASGSARLNHPVPPRLRPSATRRDRNRVSAPRQPTSSSLAMSSSGSTTTESKNALRGAIHQNARQFPSVRDTRLCARQYRVRQPPKRSSICPPRRPTTNGPRKREREPSEKVLATEPKDHHHPLPDGGGKRNEPADRAVSPENDMPAKPMVHGTALQTARPRARRLHPSATSQQDRCG